MSEELVCDLTPEQIEYGQQQIIKENEQIEKDKKNKNFVMDFRDSMPVRRALHKQDKNALVIFDFFKFKMDYQNYIQCSSKILEEYFGFSKSTITLAIKALVDHKFVKILKSGNSNVYCINADICWSSWSNQKTYAELDVKVIVALSEQDKEIETKVKSQTNKFRQLKRMKLT